MISITLVIRNILIKKPTPNKKYYKFSFTIIMHELIHNIGEKRITWDQPRKVYFQIKKKKRISKTVHK